MKTKTAVCNLKTFVVIVNEIKSFNYIQLKRLRVKLMIR